MTLESLFKLLILARIELTQNRRHSMADAGTIHSLERVAEAVEQHNAPSGVTDILLGEGAVVPGALRALEQTLEIEGLLTLLMREGKLHVHISNHETEHGGSQHGHLNDVHEEEASDQEGKQVVAANEGRAEHETESGKHATDHGEGVHNPLRHNLKNGARGGGHAPHNGGYDRDTDCKLHEGREHDVAQSHAAEVEVLSALKSAAVPHTVDHTAGVVHEGTQDAERDGEQNGGLDIEAAYESNRHSHACGERVVCRHVGADGSHRNVHNIDGRTKDAALDDITVDGTKEDANDGRVHGDTAERTQVDVAKPVVTRYGKANA